MRRIDAIAITFGAFLGGGVIYFAFKLAGVDSLTAGVWSQVVLISGLMGWVATYLFRATTQTMTYNQQMRDYEDAVLQKRLDEMSPEEIAKLQAEIAEEEG